MSGQGVRYVAAGIAGLAGLALVIAAIALLTRSDDATPVSIVAPTAAPASKPAPDIKVQVSGEVMFPGVYSMSPDDRVIDAIAAAGGNGPNADLSGINLSMRVQDEARYHVPAIGEYAPVTYVSAANSGQSNRQIDLNTAPSSELELLPGIGRRWRTLLSSTARITAPLPRLTTWTTFPASVPRPWTPSVSWSRFPSDNSF